MLNVCSALHTQLFSNHNTPLNHALSFITNSSLDTIRSEIGTPFLDYHRLLTYRLIEL